MTRTAAIVCLLVVAGAGVGLGFLLLDRYGAAVSFDDMLAVWMAENRELSIEEHVPGPEEFDTLLTACLWSYFLEETGRSASVSYELLRDYPSQSGLGYPKYYAWVHLFDGSDLVGEGVVRVGVVEQDYFYVTHYFSADEAKQGPAGIREVFAEDVVQAIEQRLK